MELNVRIVSANLRTLVTLVLLPPTPITFMIKKIDSDDNALKFYKSFIFQGIKNLILNLCWYFFILGSFQVQTLCNNGVKDLV